MARPASARSPSPSQQIRAGKPLERHPLGRQIEPALQRLVPWKELPQRLVDHVDVGRVPREHRPPERPDTAAEERPDIGRDESRVCERFLDACL